MFTGIVETMGTVERTAPGSSGGRTLWIHHELDPSSVALGDSIAHGGVCLTVVAMQGKRYSVQAGPETLQRTTVGEMRPGDRVNLERSVTAATRLGGHLVQGHVDAVGKVTRLVQRDNAWDFDIEAPAEVLRLVIPRGSVAVDGVSLTVTGRSKDVFSISIIPHTWKVTTLGRLAVGSRVNLEADVIARYVAGLLESFAGEGPPKTGLTEDFLREHGFGV